METLFWIGLVGAAYSYFLYPLILLLLPKRVVRKRSDGPPPMLTLIVTAHNEASRIRRKLENCLELDYPPERLEILVASDASTDGTDAVVGEFAGRGVRLVRAEERKGKEWAQLQAIRAARGDVLVFSDVATDIPRESLRQLAEDFRDPQVGAVSSEDRFVAPDGEVVGEGLYVRYEMWLRRKESAIRGLVGLSGSFFAARRDVCEEWDILAPSDFNTALNCARLGYVAISDPQVLGYYPALRDERREYQRKLRTVLRGITGLMRNLRVLNPLRFGWFSVQVWGHKVMRWLVPWFLLLLLLSSAELAVDSWFYRAMLVAQLAFYALVIGGALSTKLRRLTLVKVPYFFVQVNIAIAHASLAFLAGRRVTVWQPSKR